LLGGEALGLIGGALTTCSLIPQLIRVFKLRSAYEISLIFTLLLLIGIILWIAYGIYFKHLPIILWNAASLALVAGLLYAKLKYGRGSNPK